MNTVMTDYEKPLDRYLSVTDVWALAFGCMVGWGVFAMPGTMFLPVAGPLGTLIAMLVSTALMLVIGSNFSYLMSRFVYWRLDVLLFSAVRFRNCGYFRRPQHGCE